MNDKRMRSMRLVRSPASAGPRPATPQDIDRLRRDRVLTDAVTGLTLHPLADFRNERIAHLGVIYLQLGRFAGVESLYGWELYDRVLCLTTASLQEDMRASPLRAALVSLQFTGSDGFYLLFDLSARFRGREQRLEEEANRLRNGVIRRLRQTLGRTAVDLMNVHTSCMRVSDDPRVRPTRNILRGLREAARTLEIRETGEMQELVSHCKAMISGRKLRAVYQPVLDIRDRKVIGHEALIRGPLGSRLEMPDLLFATALQGELSLDLENLCLETIFSRLPRTALNRKLFVNASARFLAHSVFLDDRNLEAIRRAHPSVVVEVSEKEMVFDYASFRDVLDRLRASGLQIAIDDAGSGYSGLESILQLRPEYIKVANSIVHNLHQDTIKREIITALCSLGRQINASIVAEGIERPEEIRSLLELGVHYGQGFLLGRPSGRVGA